MLTRLFKLDRYGYRRTIPLQHDTAGSALLLIINYLHSKNYRKPLLQRYVVRILLMYRVPALRMMSSMLSCGQGPHLLDCFLGQHGLPDSRRLS